VWPKKIVAETDWAAIKTWLLGTEVDSIENMTADAHMGGRIPESSISDGGKSPFDDSPIYPLVNIQTTMENPHFEIYVSWVYPL
jgi:hypothetical protein